jgi:hypothetical protein
VADSGSLAGHHCATCAHHAVQVMAQRVPAWQVHLVVSEGNLSSALAQQQPTGTGLCARLGCCDVSAAVLSIQQCKELYCLWLPGNKSGQDAQVHHAASSSWSAVIGAH